MFELIDFKTKVYYSIVKLQTKYGAKMFEEIPNKSTFESEKLVVDYISFKFQYLEDSVKTQIANSSLAKFLITITGG